MDWLANLLDWLPDLTKINLSIIQMINQSVSQLHETSFQKKMISMYEQATKLATYEQSKMIQLLKFLKSTSLISLVLIYPEHESLGKLQPFLLLT